MIDLNSVSKEELMEIPGVGPTLADNIIRFREEHGEINDVDDLREVSGISESTIEEIRVAMGESKEEEEDIGSGESGESEESEEW